jgi:S1-C subfamily serine protease
MLRKRTIVVVLLAFVATMIAVAPVVAGKDTPKSNKGWLGVFIQDVTTDIKEAMDLKSKRGVLVRDVVEDSPAEEAGMRQEDVITTFEGKKVRDSSKLTKLIRSSSPGQEVELAIIRDGKEKTIIVTLGKRPKSEFSYEFDTDDFLSVPKKSKPQYLSLSFFSGSRIGVRVQDLSEQLGDHFGVEDGEGALITEVEEDMPAHKAGLEAGDVIVEVDGEEIEDTGELREIISEKEEGDEVEVKVIRDRKAKTFEVEVEEGEAWSASDWSGLNKLKVYTDKLEEPQMFWQEKHSSELEEEMEELREELKELKEELEDLRHKLR